MLSFYLCVVATLTGSFCLFFEKKNMSFQILVRRVFRVHKEDLGAKARADFGQLTLPVILAAVKGGSAALAIMNKSPAAPGALL